MAGISAKDVKELRDKTGAGMMDCKKALQENDGDVAKAVDFLRKKGLASAGKKSGRATAEGLVESYIHFGGQIGVIVEVNCETDFVARNEAFKELVQDIAKQIAACPNVSYVSIDEIPSEIGEKEKAIALESDTLKGKPDNIKEKIVQGKVDKVLKEMCLLYQPFIKDQSITVEELIKQSISKLGENINIRRFQRYVLGEGIEKKEANLAEEVAAQTAAAKKDTADAPKAEDAKKSDSKKDKSSGKKKKKK
ncbi:MAG: translation elongation factor Ts [Cyanobacteria bacterium P01_F01_bin.42]